MSDLLLRKAVIKLAHSKPKLRGDLLPLLKTAMEFDSEAEKKKYLNTHKVKPGTKLVVKEKGGSGHHGPGFKAVKPPKGFKGVGQDGWVKKTDDGRVLTVDLIQSGGKDIFRAYVRPKPGVRGGPQKTFDSAAKAFAHVEKA